jgi:hypothetical protein
VISSNYITYAASGDTIVYKTRTGEKYHRDGCQYLRKSQIPVRLDEAVYNDNLSPCSRCNPPILDTYSQQPIESTPKIVESYSTTKSTSKTQDEEVSLENILTKLNKSKTSSSNSKKESSSSNRNVSITTNKSSSSSDDIGIAIGIFIIFSPYIIGIFISLYESIT